MIAWPQKYVFRHKNQVDTSSKTRKILIKNFSYLHLSSSGDFQYLSNHWADLKKNFCRLLSTPTFIYKMVDSFPEVGCKNVQIFFEM